MAEYVIPIYEWCFTNMIMEVIEKQYPVDSNQNPQYTHKLRLTYAMDVLAKYIESNYKQILRPLEIPQYQDTLDLITKHKSSLYDIKLSADSLQQLFESFFSSEKELDLNLTHLCPDFFLFNKEIQSFPLHFCFLRAPVSPQGCYCWYWPSKRLLFFYPENR